MKSIPCRVSTAVAIMLSVGLTLAGNSQHHEPCDQLEVNGQVEPILGLIYGPEGLDFQVLSYGCTEKSDFAVQRINPEWLVTLDLVLLRVEPDFCEGYVPFGTRIFFTYDELGLAEDDWFTILNPLNDYRVRRMD